MRVSILFLSSILTAAAQSGDPPGRAVAPKAGDRRLNPKDGLTYVWIPPGTFRMGCSERDTQCYGNEKPAHEVTISKGFWMGQTAVTVGAYKRYAHSTGKSMPPEKGRSAGR